MTKPDRWMVVKLEPFDPSVNPHYRVFGTWGGGYLSGQSWRMNSGIDAVVFEEPYYHFRGSSGSVYTCHKDSYGVFSYGHSVLSSIIDEMKSTLKITVMPEETDWMELEYESPNNRSVS